MHFVNIFTGKLLLAKERRGAPQSSRDVAYWLIVLQKSFWGDERNFFRAADAFYARRREGPYRFVQNRPRTFVAVLNSEAAAEKSKNRLSRDF
jgi:hypothetical protein